MKLRVNLYTPEFHPQPERLSLKQVLAIWLLLLVAMSGWGYLEMQEGHQLSAQRDVQQQRVDSSQQSINQLNQAVNSRTLDPRLQQLVEAGQEELRVKRLLSQRLQGNNYASGGFSEVFQALATISQQQLWLSQITINDGRMSLLGFTQDSELVPRWVNQFADYPALSQQGFAAMQLYREEPYLRFELHGTLPTPQGAQ